MTAPKQSGAAEIIERIVAEAVATLQRGAALVRPWRGEPALALNTR